MKKIILVGCVCLSFFGCASLTTALIKKSPVTNKIFLHADPQEGDYAVFVTEGNSTTTLTGQLSGVQSSNKSGSYETLMIEEVFPTELVITSNIIVYANGKPDPLFAPINHKYITDLEGNVVTAYFIEANGSEIPLKIFSPSDQEYIGKELVDLEIYDVNPGNGNASLLCYLLETIVYQGGGSLKSYEYYSVDEKSKFRKFASEKFIEMSRLSVHSVTYLAEQGNIYFNQ